ncbi:hypothetical protein CSUI_002935 [Cystoisospora suis]|uniref:Transmembrane protein n=1 Tax=Cystoisospora suis TaxID=483139 RepID=A0A2C6L2T7_9APIC|nr:hypothetical protein CSUI_002935 [Cystoisospora suis]
MRALVACGSRHRYGAVCLVLATVSSLVIVSLLLAFVAVSVELGQPVTIQEESNELVQAPGDGSDIVPSAGQQKVRDGLPIRDRRSPRHLGDRDAGAVPAPGGRRRGETKAETPPPDPALLDIQGLEQLKQHLELMRHQNNELRKLKSLVKSLNHDEDARLAGVAAGTLAGYFSGSNIWSIAMSDDK